MAKREVLRAPAPSAADPAEGMATGRTLARRYMGDAVRMLAAIAFAPDSDAPLHSKMLATKELVSIAGVPQTTPTPVPPGSYNVARGDASADEA